MSKKKKDKDKAVNVNIDNRQVTDEEMDVFERIANSLEGIQTSLEAIQDVLYKAELKR